MSTKASIGKIKSRLSSISRSMDCLERSISKEASRSKGDLDPTLSFLWSVLVSVDNAILDLGIDMNEDFEENESLKDNVIKIPFNKD